MESGRHTPEEPSGGREDEGNESEKEKGLGVSGWVGARGG